MGRLPGGGGQGRAGVALAVLVLGLLLGFWGWSVATDRGPGSRGGAPAPVPGELSDPGVPPGLGVGMGPGDAPGRQVPALVAAQAAADVAAPEADGVWISGRVVDGAGGPVAGAEILLRAPEEGGGRLQPGERPVGSSAPDGSFHLEGPLPRLVSLAARAHRAASDWSAPLRLAPRVRREGVALVVRGGACLRGTLRDRGSGEGLVGELRLHPLGSDVPIAARSRADGSFEACGLRRGSTYVIVAECEGYGPLSGPNVAFVPEAAAQSPFPRARTWTFHFDGRARAGPLPMPPGAYLLVANGPDGLRAPPRPVRVTAGRTLELEILLDRP